MRERNSYPPLGKLGCGSLWELPLRKVVVPLGWILELFENSNNWVRNDKTAVLDSLHLCVMGSFL